MFFVPIGWSSHVTRPSPQYLDIMIPGRQQIKQLTLARKPCFATFAGVGGGGLVRPPPLAFPNEAS